MASDSQGDTYFFYGTLMDPDIRMQVLGRPVTARPAVARGYRAYRHARATYPVLRPAPHGSAPGVVVDGLTEADAARLHWYEGPEYHCRRIEVIAPGNCSVSAWAFVGTDTVPVSSAQWNFKAWQSRHRTPFLRQLRATIVRPGRLPRRESP